MPTEETPIFEFPFPDAEESPNGPLQIGAAVLAVEERLATIEQLLGTPGAPAAPTPGEIIVVNGTNDPRYIAATGDATVNANGVITIGESKVVASKIAALAVEASKIANLAVETAKIANLGVSTGKLAELAVTAAKLAAEAVETGKIKALAVTEAKIAAAAVGASKLGQSAKELFPQLYPSIVGGNRYINWGAINQFVEGSGRGVTVGVFPGFQPSVIQTTGFIAENYGGVFDYHITLNSGGQFNIQAYSGALPGAVTITIYWLAIA